MKLILLGLLLLLATPVFAEVDLNSCVVQDNYKGETLPNYVWLVCEGKGYKHVHCLNAYKNGTTLGKIVENDK